MKIKLSRRSVIIVTIMTGLFIFSSILLFSLLMLFEKLINYKLSKSLAILPGNAIYESWKNPGQNIMFSLYLFNLTNPKETLEGKRPFIKEIGPYIYREVREKTKIKWDPNGDLSKVSFNQRVTYYLDINASHGDPSKDIVTSIRLPVAVLAANNISQSNYDMIQMISTPTLFISKTVDEYVWGYEDDITMACNLIFSEICPSPKIGLMLDCNGTDFGPYVVETGFHNINNVGRVFSYKNMSKMNYWSNPMANIIEGTDGSIFPPGLNLNSTVSIFSGELCRTFKAKIKDERTPTNSNKLKVYTLAALQDIPFCAIDTPGPTCPPEGLMDLSSCKRNGDISPPLYNSQPRFYNADPNLLQPFDGIKPPDRESCDTEVLVEPKSGLVLEAYKRLQINMYLKPKQIMNDVFQNFTKAVYFPIVWFEEIAVADANILDKLYNSLYVQPSNGYHLLICILAFSLLVFFIFAGLMVGHICSVFNSPSSKSTTNGSKFKYIVIPNDVKPMDKTNGISVLESHINCNIRK